MRILYASSAIGLGHASRDIPIASELMQRIDADILFLSGHPADRLLSDYGYDVLSPYSPPPLKVDRGRLKNPSSWFVKYLLYYHGCKKIAERVIRRERPDLIVSDEDFASIVVARKFGVPSIFITDVVKLNLQGYPMSRIVERILNRWMAGLFQRCEIVIVPYMGEDHGNVKYVGPIAREPRRDREALRREFGFDKRTILVTVGGTGCGGFLIERAVEAYKNLSGKEADLLLVAGPSLEPRKVEGKGIRTLGYVHNLHEMIYASDLVISLAGRSTIDEILASGTPYIIVPVKGHFEQEENARGLGFSFEDLGRLEDLISDKLEEGRKNPKHYGPDEAVSEILGVIEGMPSLN